MWNWLGTTQPRTQKARGIQLLARQDSWTSQAELIQSEDAIQTVELWDKGGFARPCPVRPRHGFVDSRVVLSRQELRELWVETVKEDPDAEVLIMPFVNAAASAVATASLIAVGPGNDGATSGKDCVLIPLSGLNMAQYLPALDNGDSPYIEAVLDRKNGATRLVQVRGGPEGTKGTGNWIPAEIVVSKVLRAEGSLLSWERDIAAAEKGTVVWAPGGTMLSHYSVHARLSDVPVVFDATAPAIGSTLQPTCEASASWDREAFRTGAREGLWLEIPPMTDLKTYPDYSGMVRAIAMACHHGAEWAGSSVMTQALGRAAAMFVRLGYAAAVAEFRHAFGSGIVGDRDAVYKQILVPGEFFKTLRREQVSRALYSFQNDNWKPNYGGKKWAKCLKACIALDDSLRAVVGSDNRAGSGSVVSVLKQINRTINLAHNNGWWLNKFSPQANLLDEMAAGNVRTTISAAFSLWKLLKAQVPEEFLSQIPKAWPPGNKPMAEPALVPVPQGPMAPFFPGYTFKWSGILNVPSANSEAQVENPAQQTLLELLKSGMSFPTNLETPVSPPAPEPPASSPAPEPAKTCRLQAALREGPERFLHFQYGYFPVYRSSDIALSEEEAAAWNKGLDSRQKMKSLYGSSTPYWIVGDDDLAALPERVRAHAQGLIKKFKNKE